MISNRGLQNPVAGGFVEALARPGKNITGFTNYEFSMGGKWLEILKGIAPADFADVESRLGCLLHRIPALNANSRFVVCRADNTGPSSQCQRDRTSDTCACGRGRWGTDCI